MPRHTVDSDYMNKYFGINYELSQERIVEQIDQTITAGEKGYVCVVDTLVLTQAYRDPAYKDVVNHSLSSILDSSWIPLFIRWTHHVKVKSCDSSQLFMDLVRMRQYHMYFVGANQASLDTLKQRLIAVDPHITDMPSHTLPAGDVLDSDYSSIAEDINHEHPDIIWVALESPKQEYFMSRLLPHLKHGVMIAADALSRKQTSNISIHDCLTSIPSMLWTERKLHKLIQKQGKGLTLLMRRFVELIRCGATGETAEARLFQGTVPWLSMLHMAERQMLAGVVFEGIRSLPTNLAPPKDVLMKWLLKSEKIHKMNELMDVRAAEAEAHFREKGFASCILKGQGLARLYAKPTSRTPGDIDIWVNGDRRQLIRMAKTLDNNVDATYHHIDYALFKDTEMELHYTPTWMYSPWGNRHMQRFFREEARWDVMAPGGGFHVPSLRLNLVFVLVHIYRHFFTEGVGMRQLLDYHCVLRSCNDASERAYVMHVLRQLNMSRFTAAIMWVLGQCFQLDGEHMLCSPDEPEGRFLLIEVMKAGNFGQYDARIHSSENETKWHIFIRRTQRNLHFLTRYPSEVLWSPLWKIWHWLWRLKQTLQTTS